MVGKIVVATLLTLAVMKPSLAVFRNCNQGKSPVSTVKCNGESTFSVCSLAKGKNATLEVDFKSGVATNTLKSKCHGIIGGVPVPFTSIDENGCDGLSPACPVKAESDYTFTTQIPVLSVYPTLTLIVKWEEIAADGSQVFCILIPAKIK